MPFQVTLIGLRQQPKKSQILRILCRITHQTISQVEAELAKLPFQIEPFPSGDIGRDLILNLQNLGCQLDVQEVSAAPQSAEKSRSNPRQAPAERNPSRAIEDVEVDTVSDRLAPPVKPMREKETSFSNHPARTLTLVVGGLVLLLLLLAFLLPRPEPSVSSIREQPRTLTTVQAKSPENPQKTKRDTPAEATADQVNGAQSAIQKLLQHEGALLEPPRITPEKVSVSFKLKRQDPQHILERGYFVWRAIQRMEANKAFEATIETEAGEEFRIHIPKDAFIRSKALFGTYLEKVKRGSRQVLPPGVGSETGANHH